MSQLAPNLSRDYLHVTNDDSTTPLPVNENFWADLAQGLYPQLEQGRLMAAFDFSEDWKCWERHPAGEEVVILIAGEVTFLLEEPNGIREVTLKKPGDYALVPKGIWHTARTKVSTNMIFLTPGAGTEHRE